MLADILLILHAIDAEFDHPVVAEAIEVAEAMSDLDLAGDALVVADCESGARLADGSAVTGTYQWEAQNPDSSASGAFQFVDATWEWVTGLSAPASAHPPQLQLAAFYRLWADGAGRRHWEASASCWTGRLRQGAG